MRIEGKSIAFRAARQGTARPVLELAPDSVDCLLHVTGGDLRIEGLELRHEASAASRGPGVPISALIRLTDGSLTLKNARIQRRGTPRELLPFLILTGRKTPAVTIEDSELEDENGICLGQSSEAPAPSESVRIERSRFLGRRWLFYNTPGANDAEPAGSPSTRRVEIRESWARCETAIALGRELDAAGRLRLEFSLERCRIECAGPLAIAGGRAGSLEGFSLRDRDSVLSLGHREPFLRLANVRARLPAEPGDPAALAARWRAALGLPEGGDDPWQGTRWLEGPLFSEGDPGGWRAVEGESAAPE
jgi:hypothetical protein